MFKVLMILATSAFFMNGSANATVDLPPVNMKITGTVNTKQDYGWTASGFRYITTKANSSSELSRAVLPVDKDGFNTEQDCIDWVDGQNAMIVPVLETAKTTTQKVVAECSDTRTNAQ